MTECKQDLFIFQGLGSRKVEADFSGGYVSSDGGGLILRALESKLGLIKSLSGCFQDGRNPEMIEHSVQEMLAQRVYGLALGYEDLNDHDRLRWDPVMAVLAGKKDVLGEGRLRAEDRGKALAGKATLNRFELGIHQMDNRYKKISVDLDQVGELLLKSGVKMIPRKSERIVLDFDATDDPLHGKQEGAFFHGYYKQYCYLPLYCFCGNIPLWAQLRDCKRDASLGTVEALARIVPAIRARFGEKVQIVLRADSGFAREEIFVWCEKNRVDYCVGLAKNPMVTARLQKSFSDLEQRVKQSKGQLPLREFISFTYQTKKSWNRARRVIGKAELLEKGRNPRFIVTSLEESSAADLYEKFYCARGDMENRIKEQQQDLFADRTSTHWLKSNQWRLYLSAFTHLIFSVLQADILKTTRWARATIGQIRLQLCKIGARVKVSCRRIHLELASSYVWQEDFVKAFRAIEAFPYQ